MRRRPRFWRKIAGLPEERIIRIATSDNFWRMGDTGPCGPCSEIFYDHGPSIPGGPPGSPDEDGDRFIEIWNLVFMQYEEGPPGTRAPLPRPSIDTGMGLERFAAILQGKHDNYDTDTLRALVLASAEATGRDPDGAEKTSHRVVADHLRSSCFLIADGVLPSNEGRGYVLRRIMRRAMRHAYQMGATEPLMPRLVPALVRQMGQAYPELGRAQTLMTDTLRLEETRFRSLLERGLHLLAEETDGWARAQTLPGAVAFRLYDTFGFPLDLTQDALREQGRAVDRGRLRGGDGRAAHAAPAPPGRARGDAATDRVWFDLKEQVGATEFLGYATESAEGEIRAIVACMARRSRAPWPAARSPSSSTRRPSMPKAAARLAIRARSPGADGLDDHRHRYAEEARRSLHPFRPGRERARPRRVRRCGPRSTTPGAAPSAPITRRPICCMRRCAASSAPMSRRRAASTRPTGCASISAIRSRSRRGTGHRRGRGQCPHP